MLHRALGRRVMSCGSVSAGALALAAGLGVSAGAARGGLVTANWLNAASGTWNVATNWSTNPNFPNNGTPAGEVYHAVIGATGAAYTVTLNSTVTIDQFTLSSANATVEHSGGTLSVLGGGAALNAGVYRLNGGTISGGTWTVAGGTLAFGNNGSSALSGVTVQGTGDFTGTSARVRLRNGSSFTGDVTLSGASSILGWEQTSSLLSGRSVIFDTATSGGKFLSVEGTNTLTIDSGATVRGRSGTIRGALLTGGGTQTVINNGLISSDFSGPGIDIQTLDVFTNNGVVEVINGSTGTIGATSWTNGAAGTLRANGAGSTLSLGGNWSSAGTLEVMGGTLNLGGTFASTSLSGLNRVGGTVNITGAMDNSGQTLALSAGTGTVVLSGGTITGGTVTESGGSRLAFTNSNASALNGVTVQGAGDFTAASARVRLRNGSSFTGDVTLSGTNSILGWEQTSSLLSGRSVIFDAATSGGKFLTVEGNNTLTIDSGATVRGRNGTIRGSLLIGGGAPMLVNNGLISADFSGVSLDIGNLSMFTNNGVAEAINGSTLSIAPTTWTNSATGTLRVNGVGSVLSLGGAWSNAGTLEVTNGTLNLGGTFTNTGSGFSGLVRSGGAVNITGSMINTGQSLAINAATGTITLANGSITGGTVVESGGSRLALGNSGQNFLDGVTVQGTGDFSGTSARVRLRNGSSFTGDVTLSATSSILAYEQTASLASGRSVIFDSATSGGKFLTVEGNNTLTIDSGATVRGRNGTIRGSLLIGGGAPMLVNNGLISADFAGVSTDVSTLSLFTNNGVAEAINGSTLSIAPTTWTNSATGTLRVNGVGSVLSLGGAWSNAGTLEVTNGTLNLGGTFTNTGSGFSGLVRSGGAVNITGSMINTGQSLAINAATGTITLSNGSITGGTVVESGGSRLALGNSGQNFLDGVTVQGTGDFSGTSARVRLRNGSAFTGDVTLSATSSILAYEQTASLASGRSVIFDSATSGGKFLTVEGNNTLTIDSGATVRGRNGTIRGALLLGGGTQAVVNHGLISADFSGVSLDIGNLSMFTNNGVAEAINGSTLSIAPTTWTNSATGTLRANGAGSTVSVGGAWSNVGALEVTNGTLNLGGSFASSSVSGFNRTGGEVNITGSVNNTGGSLAINAASGTLVLSGGTITGGTVVETGGSKLAFSSSNSNILDGVTVQGTGDFTGSAARARLRNGSSFAQDVTLTGNSSVLAYEQTASLAAGRTVLFDTATSGQKFLTVEGTNTLTIDSGATVRGRGGIIRGALLAGGGSQSLVNNGLILAEGAGTTSISNLDSFANNGTLAAAAGGTLQLSLGSAFHVTGAMEARPGGTLQFSNGIGTIGQDIAVQLGGALTANYGKLSITAPTTINGSDLAISTVNGFSPDWGDSFAIMSFTSGAVTGDFSTLALPTLSDAVNLRWFTTMTATALTIGVRHTADVNRDNSINFADLNIIVSNFNTSGGEAMGDVDGDGFVGFADLNRVLSFFNTSAPVNTVPAPAGAALLAAAGLAGLRRRRNG